MNRILIIISLLICFSGFSQSSEKYNSDYENYYRAEDLFLKEQYAAARKEFRIFMDGYTDRDDPFYIKAAYYEGVAALELYNNDAVDLLMGFLKSYPESIYRKAIYFKLGKHFYYKKKYDDALVWFNKLSIHDIEKEDTDEFYFKLGYANFQEDNYEEARSAFYEIKDGTSQYANPALYYYSYIAYQNNSYQTALEGFLKLQEDENFGKIAPYYIAQIYYLQGKYEEVTEFAPKINTKDGKANQKDLDLIIGDAYYRTGQYKEAVPYLERYNRAVNPTREESYRLGYAYYKSGMPEKAIRSFDRSKKEEDSLGQASFYHIAECLLQLDNKVSARSAFEGAAFIDADPVIAEDALFHYAILSYKLDINPYDEAVEAFELYLNRYPNSDRKEDIYQYLVNVYTSTNNYAKALASIEKINNKDIRLKTAYQIVAFNQGVDRFQNSKYDDAIQSFKLVDKYPVDPAISGKAVYWTSDANFRMRRYDQAISGYQAFLGLPSTMAENLKSDARYNIGYSYLAKAEKYSEQEKYSLRDDMLTKTIESFRSYIQSNPPSEKKKADALLRTADAYFVMKQNDQAVKYYKEVYSLKAGFEDQALFYMAKTYGYMDNRTSDRIDALEKLLSNYKNSKYTFAAIKEIADGYKYMGQYDKALQYYHRLIDTYPNSVLVVDAKTSVADIYFKQGKHTKAEEYYLSVLEQYGSDQKVCKRVADGLKDIYLAMDRPDKIEELAKKYSCVEFSDDEQENLYYLPAVQAYNDSTKSESIRYSEAIPKLEKYIQKYPNGRYASDINYYLGNCHFELGNMDQAMVYFKKMLEGTNTGFTEDAASKVAKHLFNNGQYSEAIPYYKRVELVSQLPDNVFNAKLNLMRSYFYTEEWKNSAIYADKVLENHQLSNELKLEANYAKGMSNYRLNFYNDAKEALKWVVKNTTTVWAAESKYSLAEIEYKQGNLEGSDQLITELLKMKPTYNYWVAKGLILRSRVLIQQEDLFGAEQNLKSVLDHYPIEDDGIKDEANQLYDELMQLKNQQRELEQEEEEVIDINED